MSTCVVVTGTGGIGCAVARRLGSGRVLVLADAAIDRLEAVGEELRTEGFDVRTQPLDVADRASVQALVGAAVAAAPVTHVIHTAGISATQGSAQRLLAINLLGTAYILEEFGAVIERGGAGVVVASMAGQFAQLSSDEERRIKACRTDDLLDLPELSPARTTDNETWYRIAKRANQLHVERAALAWGSRGARINAVSPGITSTPMALNELNGPSRQLMIDMLKSSPAGRIATPADISEAVAFLLGPGAAYITGTNLLVDGGVVATMGA